MSSQIICLTGLPSSGKSQIATKLVHDFKYKHFDITNLIQTGKLPHDSPKLLESLLPMLTPHTKILLQGFPRTRDQAVAFESHDKNISKFINLICEDDILIERTLARKESKLTNESAVESILKAKLSLKDLLKFYKAFGLVQNIQCAKDSDEVYEQVKRAMLPQVIYLYGPPRTGKSTVGRALAAKIGYEYVNYEEVMGRLEGDRFTRLNRFVEGLKFSGKGFFVVDQLVPTREEYEILVNHLGEPYKVFSFESPKDQVQKNLHLYSKQPQLKPNTTKYLQYLHNRPTLLPLLKDKPYLHKINAVQPLSSITKDILELIRPIVLATYYNIPQQENYVKRLEKEKGWTLVDVRRVVEGHVARGTQTGKAVKGGKPETKQILEALKQSIFCSGARKVLLTNMGDDLQPYLTFQRQLFNLTLLQIQFQKKGTYRSEQHPILHFFSQGRYLRITQNRLDLVDSKITPSFDYGIIFGAPSSGKTTIAKALAKAKGWVLIDWEPTLAMVKEKYLTETEKGLEEIPFNRVIQYFRDLAAKKETVVMDGFALEKNFEQFVREVGAPSWVVNVKVDKPVLIRRTRVKNQSDVNAEVSEQQNQKTDASIQKGNTYLKLSQKLADQHSKTKSYTIDANDSLDKTLNHIQRIFSKRLWVVHMQQQQPSFTITKSLSTLWKNICLQYNLLYIDVDELAYDHYHRKDSAFSSQLQNQLKMSNEGRVHVGSCSSELVTRMVNQHLQNSKFESADILLLNYPSTPKGDSVYPRASDQVIALERNLGEVRFVCIMSKNQIEMEMKDPVMKLERPPEPVKEKKEGEEPPADPPAEQKKPEFSIYDYQWSDSNGRSKTLGQWYCTLKPHAEKITIEAKTPQDKTLYTSFSNLTKKIRQDANCNILVHLHRRF